MSTLSYTAAVQNRIAQALRGMPYTNLTTNEKTVLDATWTTGALTGGFALDALTQIQQIGQWFSMTAPASVPIEWEQWLVARTVMLAGQQMGPDRMDLYVEAHDNAEMAAIDAYSRQLITYDPGATPEATTLTVQNIRYHVISYCVRRLSTWETVEGTRRRRPRQWVPFTIVDNAIERTLRNLWSRAEWTFRRRNTTMTVSASSVVAFPDLSGETFDQFATRKMYYTDATGGGMELQWLSGDDMARARAYADGGAYTGRPLYFRYENKAGTLTFDFFPRPDAAYTLRCEVYVKGPTLGTLSDTTTAMARFPNVFNHVIMDAVLAVVLDHMGDRNGKIMRESVEEEISRMLPIYADVGRVDDQQSPRDMYRDRTSQRSFVDPLDTGGFGSGGL